MMKKFYNIEKTLIYKGFFLIAISIIYASYVYFFTNINGDWRHYIDSEILWPYNVLLILSDKEIEFDAYGFFYFILEYKFFQILDFLNLLKTTHINDLNNGLNFSEKLENLILAGRWFNILIIYITLLISFIIFKSLSKNSIFSFLLVLIFMVTPGMIQQLSHARVDVLVSTLMLISFFYLIKFSENKNKLDFIFFIVFFFLSVFTKVQSYIFLFALILSSAYFINNKYQSGKGNKLNFWVYLILFVFISFCIIYPLVFHRHAKFSIVFLYSQLIILNIYLYFLFKNNRDFLKENLIYTSITFLIIFVFVIIINQFSYIGANGVKLTFFEPMEIRMYLTEGKLRGMDVITLDIKKNLIYFYNLSEKIIIGFTSTSLLVFTEFSSNTILILINLFLSVYFYVKEKNKKDFLLILPVLSFFLINSINDIRGQKFELYLTYSEFLLYIPLCIYFYKNNSLLKKILSICLIVSFFTPIILNPNQYNNERFIKKDRFDIWCDSFLYDYTRGISKNEIKKICH